MERARWRFRTRERGLRFCGGLRIPMKAIADSGARPITVPGRKTRFLRLNAPLRGRDQDRRNRLSHLYFHGGFNVVPGRTFAISVPARLLLRSASRHALRQEQDRSLSAGVPWRRVGPPSMLVSAYPQFRKQSEPGPLPT